MDSNRVLVPSNDAVATDPFVGVIVEARCRSAALRVGKKMASISTHVRPYYNLGSPISTPS